MKKVKKDKLSRRKRKTTKVLLTIFVSLLIILTGLLSYAYWEYKQGLASVGKSENQKIKTIDFHGEENLYGKVNVLLLGIDSRGEEDSRTDTMMVAQYDPDTKKSKIISIMRDCYVEIPGYGEHRINAANAYGGPDLLRETITNLFSIDIQYYALVDFKGFSKMIDSAFPKGIEVNVEKEMSEGIGVTLHPGVQKLHGKELLGYARFRKDSQSDWGRVERQQKVIKLLAENMTSVKGIVKIPRMVGTIQPYIETNIDSSMILSIMRAFLSEKNRNIETLTIPVDGSYENVKVGRADVIDIDVEMNKLAIYLFLKD